MKIRLLALVLGALLISVGIFGCSSKVDQPKEITFLNYGENIDKKTLQDFENETGIKVNLETFDDMETMYQKLSKSSAPYDVVLVSDQLMPRMIVESLLQPLDKNKIPNLEQMDDHYLNLEIDPQNRYSVPYMFGTVGLIYNKKMVKEPVDSWQVLWDEAYFGKVFMFDTYRDTMGVALKTLGYSLNDTDPNHLAGAIKLLREQREKIKPIYGVDNGTTMIANGETAINMIWSGEGLNLQEENEDLVYIIPKEGANFWIDSLCIPSKSKQKEAAEIFINYVSGKTCALRIADEIGYTTPNLEARKEQSEKIQNNRNAYMPSEVRKQCEIYKDLSQKEKEMYYDFWTTLKTD